MYIKIVSYYLTWVRIRLLLIIVIPIFFGCEIPYYSVDEYGEEESNSSYVFDIDPRLPIDNNGYYHLTLNRSSWQTLHRISGRATDSNGHPAFYYWVEWESNLYWYLGDTLGYIINRNLNDSGYYVNTDTSYIIGFNGMEVPTSNGISYSNSNGEINNMIAPVLSMVGDTMRLSYETYDSSGHIYIVLE